MRAFEHLDNGVDLCDRWATRRSKRWIGIIGHGVTKSTEQGTAWNYLLDRLHLDAEYVPFDLPPEAGAQVVLAKILEEAEANPDILGFKVASPHKEAVFRTLETRATSVATRLAVANTVGRKNGTFFCTNTDGDGMYENLREAFGDIGGLAILIIGAGGAAAAIGDRVFPVARRLIVANRTADRAQRLKQLLERNHPDKQVQAIAASDIASVVSEMDLVINATPVGREGSFEPFSVLASTNMAAEDNQRESKRIIGGVRLPIRFASTLYRPAREGMLQQAEKHGHRVVNGLGMWIYQAAIAAKECFFKDALHATSLRTIAAVMREGWDAASSSVLMPSAVVGRSRAVHRSAQ